MKQRGYHRYPALEAIAVTQHSKGRKRKLQVIRSLPEAVAERGRWS